MAVLGLTTSPDGRALLNASASYANSQPVGGTGAAETFPLWAASGSSQPTAGTVALMRITLTPGVYTTITVATAATAASTAANCYLGLCDTSYNRLTVSSDISSTFNSAGLNAYVSGTISQTVSAITDYYVALLIGSAGTVPALLRGASAVGAVPLGTHSPPLALRGDTGQTAIPATVTAVNSTGIIYYWARVS